MYLTGIFIAQSVLLGLVVLPLLFLWFIVLLRVKTRKDRARDSAIWLNVAWPFLAIGELALLVSAIFALLFLNDYYGTLYSDAVYYASSIGIFLATTADVAIMLTLATMGVGFLHVLNHAQFWGATDTASPEATLRRHPSEFVIYGVAVLRMVFAVASFGMSIYNYEHYTTIINGFGNTSKAREEAYSQSYKNYHIIEPLRMVVDVMGFVASLCILVLAGLCVKRSIGTTLQSSSILYTVASFVWFVSGLWSVISQATWGLTDRTTDDAFTIYEVVLSDWTIFSVIFVLFIILARRQRGLWTTHQPWMMPIPMPAPVLPQPLSEIPHAPNPATMGEFQYKAPSEMPTSSIVYEAPAFVPAVTH